MQHLAGIVTANTRTQLELMSVLSGSELAQTTAAAATGAALAAGSGGRRRRGAHLSTKMANMGVLPV